jgi:hypothetical protein
MTKFPRRRQRQDMDLAQVPGEVAPAQPDPCTPAPPTPLADQPPEATGVGTPLPAKATPDVGRQPLVQSRAAHGSQSRPGALVVIGEDGQVQYASKPSEQLFGLSLDRLVGTDLYSLVEPDDGAVLRWAIDGEAAGAAAPRRVMLSPPLVRIRRPGGSIGLAELWATGPADGDGHSGVVLFRERTILYGIKSALAWVLDGAPLGEVLQVMTRFLACEPARHTCFFITADSENRRAERIPELSAAASRRKGTA